MFISRLVAMFRLFKRIRIAYRSFYTSNHMLKNGRYRLSYDFRTFKLQDEHICNISKDVIQMPDVNKLFMLVNKILPMLKVNNVVPNEIQGTLLYLSNDSDLKYNVKIFCFEAKTVCTVFYSDERYKICMQNMDKTISLFPTVSMNYYDPERRLICENLVEVIPKGEWTKTTYNKIYLMILDTYMKYSDKVKYELKPFNRIYSKPVPEDDITSILLKQINRDRVDEMPVAFIHNDLSLNNVLYTTKDSVLLIDWEHACIGPFYIDIFFCILNEYMQYNNEHLLIQFFSGSFDDNLEKIFSNFGIEFGNFQKLTWIYLILLSIYLRSGVDKKSNKKIYHDFIDKCLTLEKGNLDEKDNNKCIC